MLATFNGEINFWSEPVLPIEEMSGDHQKLIV
jgi:hypothetical protein